MARRVYRRIISLVLKAELARSVGIHNLLQPGLIKEMIIADILGHELIHSKRDADAHAPGSPAEKYEYFSCKEGGTGQIDRMFKKPSAKRMESLSRITRNKKLYLAVFYAENQTRCEIIYELNPDVVREEAERQLDRSRNAISHVGFLDDWAKQHGRVVYRDSAEAGDQRPRTTRSLSDLGLADGPLILGTHQRDAPCRPDVFLRSMRDEYHERVSRDETAASLPDP